MSVLGDIYSAPFVRYAAVSAAALVCDVGSFAAMVASGLPVTGAAALGYALGVVVHWVLSSRLVFAAEVGEQGSPRRRVQKALFAGSAAIGLGVTAFVTATSSSFGAPPAAAKLLAVIASFQAVWFVRRQLVFDQAGTA
ncbi:GtrA family protein [Parvularcula dongshanensis]|uniref:Putative flippase GtrA n=1 Tax=Parvularcula dongshanensis TaxID=1173995 RepID=A0A840I0C6_9PROT|nr:putative flippase GtrA [Parvularcula dongshanensis]